MAHAYDALIDRCDDFVEFMSELKRLRRDDDNITYALNKTDVTTRSSTPLECGKLFAQWSSLLEHRRTALDECIARRAVANAALQTNARAAIDASTRSTQSHAKIAEVQRAATMRRELDVLEGEQDVERILARRVGLLFRRRCRHDVVVPDAWLDGGMR